MEHEALGDLARGHLPDLLDAHLVDLRIHGVLLELQHLLQLPGQVPPGPFPEDRDPGLQPVARLEVGTLGAIGVHTLVCGLDADHPGAARGILFP